jgi:predicted deacetylase
LGARLEGAINVGKVDLDIFELWLLALSVSGIYLKYISNFKKEISEIGNFGSVSFLLVD